MKRLSLLAALTALTTAMPAQAALIADYELNGDLTNAAGPATLSNNGGTLGATGIMFGAGQGPSITGFANTGVYTIDTVFSLDQLGGYRRLMSFLAGNTSDSGLYSLNAHLNFYPVTTSPSIDFAAGVPARLTLSRDAGGLVTGYVNGAQVISFTDSSNLAVIASTLYLFTDDSAVGGEQSGGFVDYVRVWDEALTPDQAVPPQQNAVPEPATWAMMIAGFGIVGAARRRRRIAARIA